MKRNSILVVGLGTLLGAGFLAPGCGDSGSDNISEASVNTKLDASGTGGATGSGGATSFGGATGSGGATGAGDAGKDIAGPRPDGAPDVPLGDSAVDTKKPDSGQDSPQDVPFGSDTKPDGQKPDGRIDSQLGLDGAGKDGPGIDATGLDATPMDSKIDSSPIDSSIDGI